ncbi:MAG TPA: B12-binding domain-containing radical SAM protein [Candidatus Omnitrophica bacterium]|nr:B12-binding domain-containing radical SAM protein [Candidatus Omnitrophota bacterium]
MSTNSLLITFAGYPYTPSSLLPDNGMANLASSLLKQGHHTEIMDLNTTTMIAKLVPPEFHRRMKSKTEKILLKKGKGVHHLLSYLLLVRRLERFQYREFFRIAEEIVSTIKSKKLDFVGLKLWNGDGFVASKIIARQIKRYFPNVAVFGGGAHVDIFRENIYKATDVFDCLVFGEGEETIVMLAEYVEGKRKLESIPNVIFKKDGKIVTNPVERIKNLDTIPMPVYAPEIYPAMKGKEEKIKMIVLDESRGCSHRCHFCIQPVKSGNLRTKSPKRLVDELEKFVKDERISLFRFAGSFTPPRLFKGIAEEIIRRGLKVEYSSFGHVKGITPETLKLLKKSGCYAIFYGMESGSQKILDRMNKNVKIEDIEHTLRESKEAGIFTVVSIIFPAPFESKESEKETLDILLKIRPDGIPVQMPGVYPQTEWANNPSSFNIELDKETYPLKIMNYKIKLFFPPRFWKSLPYRINGKKHREFSSQTEKMIDMLEKNGLLTAISDDLALLAKYAEMSPREFRDKNRIFFLTGNEEMIRQEISKINTNVMYI